MKRQVPRDIAFWPCHLAAKILTIWSFTKANFENEPRQKLMRCSRTCQLQVNWRWMPFHHGWLSESIVRRVNSQRHPTRRWDGIVQCQSVWRWPLSHLGPHGPAERGNLSHFTFLLRRSKQRWRRRVSPPSPNTPRFVGESRGLGGDKWWRLWCKVIPSKPSDFLCNLWFRWVKKEGLKGWDEGVIDSSVNWVGEGNLEGSMMHW